MAAIYGTLRLGRGFVSQFLPRNARSRQQVAALVNKVCQTRLLSETARPISRFLIPEMQSMPKDVRDRIEETAEKSGFIPNVFLTLAHRPDEFRAFFSYYDALMLKEEGSLTKAEKELIVVATSANNNCTYCVVAHGALLRIYSKKRLLADQVAINWKHADLSEREKAILEFATAVGKGKPIVDIDFQSFEKHGLSKEDVWDIGAIAAFFAMSNRLAHVSNMRPNDEFYLLGRVPKDKTS